MCCHCQKVTIKYQRKIHVPGGFLRHTIQPASENDKKGDAREEYLSPEVFSAETLFQQRERTSLGTDRGTT